mmetsp:Transcript_12626/g.28306  ORF Transcript_12626/g.28306 Transcript_12626/m.28306 type:complete len:293 (+) Transcript_12626:108-986(+)
MTRKHSLSALSTESILWIPMHGSTCVSATTARLPWIVAMLKRRGWPHSGSSLNKTLVTACILLMNLLTPRTMSTNLTPDCKVADPTSAANPCVQLTTGKSMLLTSTHTFTSLALLRVAADALNVVDTLSSLIELSDEAAPEVFAGIWSVTAVCTAPSYKWDRSPPESRRPTICTTRPSQSVQRAEKICTGTSIWPESLSDMCTVSARESGHSVRCRYVVKATWSAGRKMMSQKSLASNAPFWQSNNASKRGQSVMICKLLDKWTTASHMLDNKLSAACSKALEELALSSAWM